MTHEQFETLLEAARFSSSISWFLFLAVSMGLLVFGAYLRKKGENIATTEDVDKITRAVEEVKSEFTRELEFLRQYHSLAFVAAEKRLEAHQQAYSLLIRAGDGVHDRDTRRAISREMFDWWNEWCFYLSKKGREAFHSAFYALDDYAMAESVLHSDRDSAHRDDAVARSAAASKVLREIPGTLLNSINLTPLDSEESQLSAPLDAKEES